MTRTTHTNVTTLLKIWTKGKKQQQLWMTIGMEDHRYKPARWAWSPNAAQRAAPNEKRVLRLHSQWRALQWWLCTNEPSQRPISNQLKFQRTTCKLPLLSFVNQSRIGRRVKVMCRPDPTNQRQVCLTTCWFYCISNVLTLLLFLCIRELTTIVTAFSGWRKASQ